MNKEEMKGNSGNVGKSVADGEKGKIGNGDVRSHRYGVIMCGGVGSRFWPFSRESRPKQFLDFFGTGRSLLQLAYDRLLAVTDPERIVLVTNAAYREIIMEQLPEVKEDNILLEPARRNTAPCICWAAHHIISKDGDASIVTVPSDHLILKEGAFTESLLRGFEFVEEGNRLLTIGLKPTMPHTGYGYIQRGSVVWSPEGSGAVMKVKSFTEKPDLEMAKVFLESGEFLWNSGMFLWRADSILKAFVEHDPETAAVFNSGAGTFGTPEEMAFINANFETAPSNSIDYAIMEKAGNVYVEEADLGWSDLGNWGALYDISPKSKEGNVTQNCNVLASDCGGSLFATGGDKVIVARGLKDFIVADEGNALLICPRADEQKVRQSVNEVRERFGEDYV